MKRSGIADSVSLTLSLALLLPLALLVVAAPEHETPRRNEPRWSPPKTVEPNDSRPQESRPRLAPVVLPDPPSLVGEPAAVRELENSARPREIVVRHAAKPEPPKEAPAYEITPLAPEHRPPPDKASDSPKTITQEPSTTPKSKHIRAEPEAPAEETEIPPPEQVRKGRALLKILEHGSGPSIQIAWPASAGQRTTIYRRFRDCYGLRTALMDAGGRLFTDTGSPGIPWPINLDHYSGFIRTSGGELARDETSRVRAIRARHGDRAAGEPVRFFPRGVDALLLGELNRIIESDYRDIRQIRARYRLEGDRVFVDGVFGDDRHFPGRIDLSAAAAPSCRLARS